MYGLLLLYAFSPMNNISFASSLQIDFPLTHLDKERPRSTYPAQHSETILREYTDERGNRMDNPIRVQVQSLNCKSYRCTAAAEASFASLAIEDNYQLRKMMMQMNPSSGESRFR